MSIFNTISSLEEFKSSELSQVDYLANVSHEIRNPLTAIIGLSRLLKGNSTPEEKEEYLEGLVQTSENLLEIVNNLMDYSKLGSGKLQLSEAPVDLKILIARGLHGQKIIAKTKNLYFTLDLDPEIPDRLLIDSVKLNQLLVNLVSNALKFTVEGGVTVSVNVLEKTATDVTLAFAVRDTGRGISKEHLQTIFKAFNQGHGEINLQYGGTGLGLTISKKVVEMLGSHLEVESELGKGSEFRFALECQIVSGDITPENPLSPGIVLKGKRVLIVDDNKLNRLVARKTLEELEIITATAANGAEALEKIEQNDFDIVLMDVKMPVMDGVEATRKIRQLQGGRYRFLPIIALTGSMVSQDEKSLKENGFTNFLIKPFLPEDLLKVMTFCSCCAS